MTENEAKKSQFVPENEVKSDEACKNINRLTYLCHDPYFYYYPDSQIVNIENAGQCSQIAKKAKIAKVVSQKNASFSQKQSASNNNNDITSSSFKEKNAFSEIDALLSLLSLLLPKIRPLYEDAKRAILEMERGSHPALKKQSPQCKTQII